jgi:hypothetical protein
MASQAECRSHDTYLKARLGKHWKAPFVGSTWACFEAWQHLCHAWYLADCRERPLIETSMAALLPVFQSSELPAAKAAIGAAGYEAAEEKLWSRLLPAESFTDEPRIEVEIPIEWETEAAR